MIKGGRLMSRTVVGLFDSHDHAETAAHQIKDQGLRTDDISIVAKSGGAGDEEGGNLTGKKNEVNDNISDGVISGGLLGGIAGLVIGAGSLVIPGLGVIAAAGPITGLLSGAVTGGIVGGLIDLGIPESRSRHYESEVKQGKVLFSMKTDEDKVGSISSILRNNGASNVEVY